MIIGSSAVDSGERCRERTCDHDPGAAHRSMMRVTFVVVCVLVLVLYAGVVVAVVVVVVVPMVESMVGNRLNCSFNCRSLNADRAR